MKLPEVLSVTPGAILMVPPLWETVGLMVASTLTLMVPVLTKLSEVPVPMERVPPVPGSMLMMPALVARVTPAP